MISMGEIERKIADFTDAAKSEQMQAPDMAQKTKAVRHPTAGDIVRIKNITSAKFEAHSFVKRKEYNIKGYYYDATLPDAEELGLTGLGLAQLAIISEEVEKVIEEPEEKKSDGMGVAYIGQKPRKVRVAEGEEVEVGDPVGSKDGSGMAIIGGPYRVVKIEIENEGEENEKTFAWVIPDDH